MRHQNTIISSILKALPRRRFDPIARRHGGERYVKSCTSWDHFVAMVYGQLSNVSSLRGLEAGWNAFAQHHYHLGAGPIRRSTLADANRRRPAQIFAEVFSELSGTADRHIRRDGAEMIRLIDSSPVPLGVLFKWAAWNGRIKGAKLHVVYDPQADQPRLVEITPANVNDVEFSGAIEPEKGATYVFDKGYYSFGWWSQLHAAGCLFVTRAKTNMRYDKTETYCGPHKPGDGFTVLEDAVVTHKSNKSSRLKIPLRRIIVKRHQGGAVLTLVSNDLARPAAAIAALYKKRWQIELLFRWLKQHLKIRSFLGRSPNAVRSQILIAMITYLLLRLAAERAKTKLTLHRFTELVGASLFERKTIIHIDKPPEPVSRPKYLHPDQLSFAC